MLPYTTDEQPTQQKPKPKPKKVKPVPQDEIEKVKKIAKKMETDQAPNITMYRRYRDIYFMDNIEQPKNQGIDDNDWKLTASPSGRNAVTGMKRLLDTSEINVVIQTNGKKHPKSDAIEAGLKKIVDVSGEFKRARIEKDAILSAVLMGPVILSAEAVRDLIAANKDPMFKKRLEKIAKRTPFLIHSINADEHYPDWGRYGMLRHLRIYKMKGDEIAENWGRAMSDNEARKDFEVWDYEDLEKRVIWVKELKGEVVLAKYHGMEDMNIVARYAGGTSLFTDPKYQIQPFLYAHAKGEWDKRENLLYTYIFTKIYSEGLGGQLFVVDPAGGDVSIDYLGMIRTLTGKATPVEQATINKDVAQIKQIVDDVGSESMIYKQTLGQNISGSAPFSSLAMLSSAGQLPLQDPREAIEMAFRDLFLHMLCRIKYEGIDNELIQPSDIPDQYEVIVTLKPKLPQDDLRNSQIAQGLGDLVSNEWKREHILQIGDSEAMTRQVMLEQSVNQFMASVWQDPQVINAYKQRILKKVLGPIQQPTTEPATPDQTVTPAAPPEAAMGDQEAAAMAQMQAQAQPPTQQTDSMIPPQERI